jgi:hypothetical protein
LTVVGHDGGQRLQVWQRQPTDTAVINATLAASGIQRVIMMRCSWAFVGGIRKPTPEREEMLLQHSSPLAKSKSCGRDFHENPAFFSSRSRKSAAGLTRF